MSWVSDIDTPLFSLNCIAKQRVRLQQVRQLE